MLRSYSYMNEDEIADELKCGVCQQPFDEPVTSTQCHHTYCKKCIVHSVNEENRCPICRSHSYYRDYHPVESRTLLNQLDHLCVVCDACQATNIRRGDFQSHIENCFSFISSCPVAHIGCDWQGTHDQLDNHMKNCSFQQNWPIDNDIGMQIRDLREQVRSHHQWINEMQREKQSKKTLIDYIRGNLMYYIPILLFAIISYMLFSSLDGQRGSM